jgi:hypothetical protein
MAGAEGPPEAVFRRHAGIGEAKTGSQVFIDWLPEGGTRLTVNGQVRGSDIAGEDFFKALLKIWLGNKPVQDDLKQALLGLLNSGMTEAPLPGRDRRPDSASACAATRTKSTHRIPRATPKSRRATRSRTKRRAS